MSAASEDYFVCPTCGEDVPARAIACPHCGADDETGWSEDTLYDDLDLPSDDIEAPLDESPPRPLHLLAAVLVIAAMLLLMFGWLLW